MVDRQRAQQQAVGGAEERGVGANAKGERQHHHGAPPFALKNDADGVTQVLQHADLHSDGAAVASRILRRDADELTYWDDGRALPAAAGTIAATSAEYHSP